MQAPAAGGAAPHPPAGGGAYFQTQDPNIIWVNRRPYIPHNFLGKGGFAEVFRVEMLLPFGTRLKRDADGELIVDHEGSIILEVSSIILGWVHLENHGTIARSSQSFYPSRNRSIILRGL